MRQGACRTGQREFDADERTVVGVNRYQNAETIRVPVLQVPVGSQERHLARLARTRVERDAAAVGAALGGLRCADAYATIGEQCRVLRGVFGEYRELVSV